MRARIVLPMQNYCPQRNDTRKTLASKRRIVRAYVARSRLIKSRFVRTPRKNKKDMNVSNQAVLTETCVTVASEQTSNQASTPLADCGVNDSVIANTSAFAFEEEHLEIADDIPMQIENVDVPSTLTTENVTGNAYI